MNWSHLGDGGSRPAPDGAQTAVSGLIGAGIAIADFSPIFTSIVDLFLARCVSFPGSKFT